MVKARETEDSVDAITLLKADHRAVEALFDDFEDADEDERGDIAERVCEFLTVHAQIEEEILYPAAKDALDDEEGQDMVNEAEVEHATAKELIAKIEAMSPADAAFKATVKVLSEYIKHHVKEEENELFPALRKGDLDLQEIGAELAARKEELMQEMGLDEDEEDEATAAAAHASRASGKGKGSPAKGRH